MKFAIKFLFTLCVFFTFLNGKSQSCGTCSINITSLDSSAYTIDSGQTFCVDTTGNFIGTIILNGGTVCNKGIFNPGSIQFNTGTISNYGNTSINTSVALGSGATFTNNDNSVSNINGAVTVNGGALNNSGIINVNQNIQNTSGTITNSSIINCTQLSGSGNLNNTGKINVN